MEEEHIRSVEQRIGYTFKQKHFLLQALTHRSFCNEHPGTEHNERLEFLGDAILQFVSTKELYLRYPEEPEGTLSVYRSLLVKTDFLVRVAHSISVPTYLRVSSGQKKEMERNTALLADVVEALIGAIFLDGGLTPAEQYIHTHILRDSEAYLAQAPTQDAKTALQELVQQERKITPVYTVLGERGPDHEKIFTVAVIIDGAEHARGEGRSKQEAEQGAAQRALDVLNKK